MDFLLNEEQDAIRQAAKEFADEVVAPGAGERDEKAEFPTEIVKQLFELGFMGMTVPERRPSTPCSAARMRTGASGA